MILRNWYNAYKSQVTQTRITDGLKNVAGTVYDSGYYRSSGDPDKAISFYTSSVDISSNISGFRILIGNGTTAPTLDDYQLESRITSGLSGQLIKTSDGSGIRYVNLTNTSSDAITVSEIGYCGICYIYTDQSSSTCCLLERSVFDPITIQPGEIAQIEYKINIDMPE